MVSTDDRVKLKMYMLEMKLNMLSSSKIMKSKVKSD